MPPILDLEVPLILFQQAMSLISADWELGTMYWFQGMKKLDGSEQPLPTLALILLFSTTGYLVLLMCTTSTPLICWGINPQTQRELSRAMAQPSAALTELFARSGLRSAPSSPEALIEIQRAEHRQWEAWVKASGFKPEA